MVKICKLACYTLILCLPVLLAGCKGEEISDEESTGSSAEVPTPGDVSLGNPGPVPGGQSEPEVGTEDNNPTFDPADVKVEIADWASVADHVAKHSGKVVVVDVWATYCIPCRKEFPGLVKLHNDLGSQVACVSVSLDYEGLPNQPVESSQQQVLDFLQEKGATFTNVLCSTEADKVYEQVDFSGIPAVYVYNQQGKLARLFANPEDGEEYTYVDDIRPFVEGLLPKE